DSQLARPRTSLEPSASLAVRIADCGIAIFVWLATLFLLAITPLFFLLPYAFRHGIKFGSPDFIKQLAEFSLKDPTAIFLQVLATLPAHLLTIALVWAVVTRFGKRSFKEAIGWSWARHFGPGSSVAIGIALFLASLGITALV